MDYNYDIWPLFYDQYYKDMHEQEHPFYAAEVSSCSGPVLEIGCGTGAMLLKLLERGVDVHGFDVALPMLAELLRRAEAKGIEDIRRRISCQDMVHFAYQRPFDAILIPARAILHVTRQSEQLETLQRAHAHLVPGGRLVLNFFAPDLSWFLEHTRTVAFEPFDRYRHPRTDEIVELFIQRRIQDMMSQLIHVTWRFRLEAREVDTDMTLRWIYPSELELMLQLAGFERWQLYGDYERTPYDGRQGEIICVAYKGKSGG